MIPDRILPLVNPDERTGLASRGWYEWLATVAAGHDDHETRIAALEALNSGPRLTSLESRATAVEGRATSLESRATALEAGPGVNNWTPVDTSGAGLTLTVNNATYAKYGRIVVASAYIIYPATGSGANSSIGGFPFGVANGGSFTSFAIFTSGAGGGCAVQFSGSSFNIVTAGPAAVISNAQLSGNFVICGFSFATST